MQTLAIRLIVAMAVVASIGVAGAPQRAHAEATLDQRYPDAQPVLACQFDESWDANFDGWPDRWTRERSPQHPPYLEIRIDQTGPNEGQQSLRVELDGGAASVYSPPVPVRAIFSYVFEAQIKTSNLKHDRAYLSVRIFDAQNKLLERHESRAVGNTSDWTRVRIGPLTLASEAAHHAIVGLHVEPSAKADLRGEVWFADVWAGRLPRMTLSTGRGDNLFILPRLPEVTCVASGFAEQEASVDFELLDVEGRSLARDRFPLEKDGPLEPNLPRGKSSLMGKAGQGVAEPAEDALFVGRAKWQPPLPGVGFYRVRVSMSGRRDAQHQREISLALIDSQNGAPRGEFGWSIPGGEKPLSLSELAELAQHAGINWLKFPVWNDGGDTRRADKLVWFAERLQIENVELIGLLTDPPADVRKHLGDVADPAGAQIFSIEPELWWPSLEPSITRLSLKVHSWQLGRDDDLSFVNYPKLNGTLATVRKQLTRYGQEVKLGFGWSWLEALPGEVSVNGGSEPLPTRARPGGRKSDAKSSANTAKLPWDFVALSADPPLAGDELSSYLAGTRGSKTARWVVLEPLPAGEYSAVERARDLVQRMLTAKMQQAEGIFIPNAYSTQRGVLNDDGTVGELLLPWRTTALALAGTQYLGSIRLPGGSANHIFARDGEMVMVLWNDTPREETMFVGDGVRRVDLWGRSEALPVDERGQQRVAVDRLPVFLRGLNDPLVRMQMSVELAELQWPSVFGVPHANALLLHNAFAQSAAGTVRMHTPEQWRVVPRELRFKLPAGEKLNEPFEVTLPFDASTGRQEVRLDFDVMLEKRYQFSVYRTIEIGLDDVYAQVSTRLSEQGELIVEQKLINQTDELVNFKCLLFAPDRRRMVTQVLEHGRGTDTKLYRVPNGQQLVGKTLWLRAEELGGRRVLNYRFAVQP